jgi:hypothetical protein
MNNVNAWERRRRKDNETKGPQFRLINRRSELEMTGLINYRTLQSFSCTIHVLFSDRGGGIKEKILFYFPKEIKE